MKLLLFFILLMPDFYDTEIMMDNPYDANYDFSFLDNYIENVRRKSAVPNNQQIENDNSFYDIDDEVDNVENQDETDALMQEGTKVEEEDFMNNDLFSEDDSPYVREYFSNTFNPNQKTSEEITNQYVPTSGNVSFKPGVTTQGWKAKAAKIVDGLAEMVGNIVVTSTVRSKAENDKVGGQKNSFHLSGDAVDIRPNANLDAFLSSSKGKAYIAAQGYEIIDERSKKSGPHWHLEPVSRQFGGKVYKYKGGGVGGPVAITPMQKYVGLNDESIDELFLPLEGINTIRGLDSGQPVHVTDETGMEVTLYGPEDTVSTSGNVNEKRLKYQTGGKAVDIQNEINWLENWYTNRKVSNPVLNKQIEQERASRLSNLKKPYTISNKQEDIGEGNVASYTPGDRVFNIPDNLDQGTALHETTHMSDDFFRPTSDFESKVIKKSMPARVRVKKAYGYTKKDTQDYFDYMTDPGEVKARLMQLRKKAGFKPDQIVTEQELQKFFDDTEGEPDSNIDELMDFIRSGGKKNFNKKVLNLLNNTVSIQRPDSNLA